MKERIFLFLFIRLKMVFYFTNIFHLKSRNEWEWKIDRVRKWKEKCCTKQINYVWQMKLMTENFYSFKEVAKVNYVIHRFSFFRSLFSFSTFYCSFRIVFFFLALSVAIVPIDRESCFVIHMNVNESARVPHEKELDMSGECESTLKFREKEWTQRSSGKTNGKYFFLHVFPSSHCNRSNINRTWTKLEKAANKMKMLWK